MNVLLLGPNNLQITSTILNSGCKVIEYSDKIDISFLIENKVNFIVSYRYRHIIKPSVLEFLKGNAINLHISLLPWNRGADPNLWSFLEDTPKGVTIHYIDEGIDTGDIIAQKEIFFNEEQETLATTYNKLNYEIISLFKENWPFILEGKVERKKQPPGGSFHKLLDKKKYEYLLREKGWNTLVKDLKGKALKNNT
ncbi:methionyl-tRNA formyltransferase [Desulfonauticus submarinus]|uniref:Methionyl-tRNA formyltransferase n=1 Tax=Desulfonauticus submarinus TaxID=206665 RepID=A0A1H0BFR5_9BACT|nr:formyltransferase family protein [Desulfonauticus submarinus]SDN44488.1 methionyl-tRNA formyltransferase [Desulfonauticus submarinus]